MGFENYIANYIVLGVWGLLLNIVFNTMHQLWFR